MDSRYLYTDDNDEPVYTKEFPVYCGDRYFGRLAHCDRCEAELVKRYPQGWRDYPGDTCIHGERVGGMGIDHMCQNCENGLDHWHNNPEYQLMVSVLGGSPSPALSSDTWRTARPDDIRYGCEQVTKYMATMVSIIEGRSEHSWRYKSVPMFEYYAIKVSSGYWSTEPQTTYAAAYTKEAT